MQNEIEEHARLMRQSSKQAIALAMEGRWQEAVAVNKGIIEDHPNDTEAHNRLGRAYMELGEYSLAREAYNRTKEIDPYNTIAEKNLRRLAHLKKKEASPKENFQRLEPQVFIEETGKAGVIRLSQLAGKEVLAEVDAGDKVNLRIIDSNLVVENLNEEYLGKVESKHSQRLMKLINGGNKYMATVISSSEDMIAVIIREIYQHPSQEGQLSFPSKGIGSLKSYVSDKILKRQVEYDESVIEHDYMMPEDETDPLSSESVDGGNDEEE